MDVVYDERYFEHDPTVPEDFPERPYRIKNILESLAQSGLAKFHTLTFNPSKKILKDVHTMEYISFLTSLEKLFPDDAYRLPTDFFQNSLRNLSHERPLLGKYSFDLSAPVNRHTFDHALRSAAVAYKSAEMLLNGGETTYALCRPPGHHAMRGLMGGFCYLNNAAVAAHHLSKSGKVAILDIDFHHGNGTQDIFYSRSDVLYVSIHADPRNHYPFYWGFADEKGEGNGKGYNLNIPLPGGTNNIQYDTALIRSLLLIKRYKPLYLVVSVGYDTYENDLLGDFKLTTDYYETMGKRIAGVNIPTMLVQEGGYHENIGENAASFISGFSTDSKH
jgi:acetoin utilization deacetylase AcuC-like enzyme